MPVLKIIRLFQMPDSTTCNLACTLDHAAQVTWRHLASAVSWDYFAPAFVGVILLAAAIPFHRAYRNWRRAWLSQAAEDEINRLRRRHLTQRSASLKLDARSILRWCRRFSFQLVEQVSRYGFRGFWRELRSIYLPSLASFIGLLVVFAVLLFIPHFPQHAEALYHPVALWRELTSDLQDKDSVPRIFEGLIIVVIALIVFVAESIRSSKTSDEKRVLLKISKLWLLTLLITASPFLFLYSDPTGLTAVLAAIIAALTLWAFAQILRNLIDATANTAAQRDFLKARVRSLILDSARQRVGNRILFDKLGFDKEISLGSAISKSWLPGGEASYVFIDAPGEGILSDINLLELGKLASFFKRLDSDMRALSLTEPSRRRDSTPAPRRRQTITQQQDTGYLLRRFREQLPEKNSIFSRDQSVLAVSRRLVERRDTIEELTRRASEIFRFSAAEPTSSAFRNEMQSTRDRLIAAIGEVSLGTIDELRQTYLFVAEQFLEMLNELGGGYSADQAREERNSFFEGWNEVRWLVDDVRELIIAAAKSDNTDVIGKITYLPFAIATRAVIAGDHLLYQEFLKFTPFIYSLGAEKLNTRVRSYMIERAWRYLRELTDFYIQSPLSEEDPDD